MNVSVFLFLLYLPFSASFTLLANSNSPWYVFTIYELKTCFLISFVQFLLLTDTVVICRSTINLKASKFILIMSINFFEQ